MSIQDGEQYKALKRNGWTNVVNNSVEYVYYTGVETGNPSGAKNIKKLIHKDGYGEIIFAINFEWDSDNDVIREYSTKE